MAVHHELKIGIALLTDFPLFCAVVITNASVIMHKSSRTHGNSRRLILQSLAPDAQQYSATAPLTAGIYLKLILRNIFI